jgi:hypothetical protein
VNRHSVTAALMNKIKVAVLVFMRA